jgi:hypothetical protein
MRSAGVARVSLGYPWRLPFTRSRRLVAKLRGRRDRGSFTTTRTAWRAALAQRVGWQRRLHTSRSELS